MLRMFFRRIRPGQLIVLVFLGIILLGAGLLCLPAAARSGRPTPFLTSLFTATSATCVTGLIRVDTGTHWTMFGQVVILLLIQVGGLGFMTIACLFFFALRRRIGLRQRMVLAQALGSDTYSGIVSLVRNILRGTAAVEGVGALILFFRFLPEFGFGRALWYGVFHSVSAFCNAGFDVLADVDVRRQPLPLCDGSGREFYDHGAHRHRRPRLCRLGRHPASPPFFPPERLFPARCDHHNGADLRRRGRLCRAGMEQSQYDRRADCAAEADGSAVPVGDTAYSGVCDL